LILICPECEKRYKTDPRRIPAGGGFVRCPGCKARIPVYPREPEAAAEAPDAPRVETPAMASPISPPPQPLVGTTAEDAPTEETPEPGEEQRPEIRIQAEEGLLVTRDLEEIRNWIFEGRVWPNDLVEAKGSEPAEADSHPLTRELFPPEAPRREPEPAPSPAEPISPEEPPADAAPAEAAEPPAQPEPSIGEAAPMAVKAEAAEPPAEREAKIEEPAPPRQEEVEAPRWPEDSGWPDETDLPALEAPKPAPTGVRSVGWLNLLLSLVLPPNPIGVIAAIGLLRGRAWGRTLTLVWSGLQLIVVGMAWFGLTALTLATGRTPGPLGETGPGLLRGYDLLTLVVVLGTALTAYLIVQWSYLSRPRLTESFTGNGERTALWGGWLLGWLYLMAAVLLTNATLQRWRENPRAAPQPAAEASVKAAPSGDRVYTADGLASIVAAPGWEVKASSGGEDAKLGILLKGSRSDPAGTLRLSTATPEALARLNERFEDLEPSDNTIKAVEEVWIGDLHGRQVVLSSPVHGGTRGDIVLSLHDEQRAYQFACTVPGPGFARIRPECEAMAASLVITREPPGKENAEPGAPAGAGSETQADAPPTHAPEPPSPAGGAAAP
jgi:predicted Zn finger-like uncharacterized protein